MSRRRVCSFSTFLLCVPLCPLWLTKYKMLEPQGHKGSQSGLQPLRCELSRSCFISKHHRLILADPASRDRRITLAQTAKHFNFFTPSDQPQNLARSIDNRVGQRHSAPALIGSGKGNVGALNIEHRVTRNQGCSVAVGPEA